jgi:hypothetical protein
MNTKAKVSKSSLALEYLQSQPKATAKEVVAALSEHGVKLSDVNNAKQKLRSTSTKKVSSAPKKRGPKPKKSTRATKATATIESVAPKKRGRKPLVKTQTVGATKAVYSSSVSSGDSTYSTIEAGLRLIDLAGSIASAREILSLIEHIKRIPG